jgi:pimeloyl-ACP methyl ester carboxylesterase
MMPRSLQTFLLVAAVFAVLLMRGAALAQEPVTLVPYSDEGYGIESVVPEGWTDLGTGVYARQRDDSDKTLIAQQSAPLSAQDLLTALLPQLGLDETPESAGTHQGAALNWTLYEVDLSGETSGIATDLALAEDAGTTYLVLLASAPDERDALYASVFLPTLDAFAPLEVEEGPVPYDVEDVTFANGGVTLAGTLTLPPAAGQHPAVVLVSGSGPQNRDESLGGGIAIKPFRLLADALTRAGVAVLRYDDRGVGESTGTFSTATVSDFAADADAAIRYLLSRDDIDPDAVGLLGHSEGGLVAAMLGARNEDLDFIIALAGPGVNGRDVLLLQNRRILEAEGATEEDIAAQVAFVKELMTVLDDPAAMETLTYERTLERLRALPDEQREAIGDLERQARIVAEQSAQQYSADWFASFLNYDPGPDWAQTTVPVLAIFGGKDVQVDAAQNAPAVAEALAQAGNNNYEIVVLPNANHLFQVAETGSITEYPTLAGEFTPDLLPTIVGWLERQGIIGVRATPRAGPQATPSATPVN